MREAFDARGDQTLFVKAPGEVAYHRVMEALDAARGAGAGRIGMLDPQPADYESVRTPSVTED